MRAMRFGAALALLFAAALLVPTVPAVADGYASPDDDGIAFGTPAVFDNGRGLELIGVLVTNNTEETKSFLEHANWIAGGETVATVGLGPQSVSTNRLGFSTVSVPVTNGNPEAHTVAVEAAFLRGGTIIGVGGTELRDLGAGQTGTISIGVIGSTDGADEVHVAIDAVR